MKATTSPKGISLFSLNVEYGFWDTHDILEVGKGATTSVLGTLLIMTDIENNF